jgi:hypothetical protein
MTMLEHQLLDYGELQDELFGPIALDEIMSRPATPAADRRPWLRRHPLALAATTMVVVLAIGGFYFAFSGSDGQVVDQTTVPTTTPVTEPEPTVVSGMWPQSSLEEVQEAQELADAGDQSVTWQLETDLEASLLMAAYPDTHPTGPEIFARFLREELGWEEMVMRPGPGFGDGTIILTYLRCAPGQTNPIYPDDPNGASCAPTIDELRYETVEISVTQPVRSGSSGIWVVTEWESVEPVEQVVPLTEAEGGALVEEFLQARVDGEGAEEYLGGADGRARLLYATSTGAPYERYEFELVAGPEWPTDPMRFEVRLVAEDGQTVVEQLFNLESDGVGGWTLEPEAEIFENRQALPTLYDILGGEVTFQADPPWAGDLIGHLFEIDGEAADSLLMHPDGFMKLFADPVPIIDGCEQGPAPADAAALAQSILSDGDFEATAPVAMTIGGAPALQMDVVNPSAPAVLCDQVLPAPVTTGYLEPGSRMRLYLVDLPGGSARILSIAVVASEDAFESVVEDATPIIDSFEFHTG